MAPSWLKSPGTKSRKTSAAVAMRGAGAVGAEAAGHAEHGLGDDGDRDQLEAVQQAVARAAVQ